ncbi:unnamed protein product [Acanthosepion pharaonis]|uniref:Uncharacterized protein n=1 Tax=Acanthosepion pharaonis TaxID=158019 RepID=A0A812E7T1_ACAPH|nr:unnamed protein product [Sepia pharaonis]
MHYLSQSIHICLGVVTFIYLFISVCSYLSIYLSKFVPISLSLSMSVCSYLSSYLSQCVSFYLSIYLSIIVFISISIYSYLSQFPSRLTPLNKKKYGQKGSDSEHSQENSTASDYSSSKRSRKSRATTRDAENGVFHVRPVKHKRSPEKTAGRQADYDKDEGGIYKSKLRNPNAEDATEVSETDQTRVDMPVDNMEAKQTYFSSDPDTLCKTDFLLSVDPFSCSLLSDVFINIFFLKLQDGHTGPIKESHPTPDEIAPISLPEHVPDVPVEGTDVDEEPNITPIKDADELAGSSQVTRKEGPTSSQPEKDEIQVPPPEQTVVAASPSEETESLGTENTEDALKEEMSQPPHEMNEMKKLTQRFPYIVNLIPWSELTNVSLFFFLFLLLLPLSILLPHSPTPTSPVLRRTNVHLKLNTLTIHCCSQPVLLSFFTFGQFWCSQMPKTKASPVPHHLKAPSHPDQSSICTLSDA